MFFFTIFELKKDKKYIVKFTERKQNMTTYVCVRAVVLNFLPPHNRLTAVPPVVLNFLPPYNSLITVPPVVLNIIPPHDSFTHVKSGGTKHYSPVSLIMF